MTTFCFVKLLIEVGTILSASSDLSSVCERYPRKLPGNTHLLQCFNGFNVELEVTVEQLVHNRFAEILLHLSSQLINILQPWFYEVPF